MSSVGDVRSPFYMVIRSAARRFSRLQGKGSTFISQILVRNLVSKVLSYSAPLARDQHDTLSLSLHGGEG